MSEIDEVLDYVENTPNNTNRRTLRNMLNNLSSGQGSSDPGEQEVANDTNFFYHISAIGEMNKRGELTSLMYDSAEGLESWSSVEQAVNDGKDINVKLTINEPVRYLTKQYNLTKTLEHSEADVSIEENSNGITVLGVTNFTSDKNGQDSFDLRIDYSNNQFLGYNHLIIATDNIDYYTFSAEIIKKDKHDELLEPETLSFKTYDTHLSSETFFENDDDTVPSIIIHCQAIQEETFYDSIYIGLERQLEDEIWEQEINDVIQDTRTYTLSMPAVIFKDTEGSTILTASSDKIQANINEYDIDFEPGYSITLNDFDDAIKDLNRDKSSYIYKNNLNDPYSILSSVKSSIYDWSKSHSKDYGFWKKNNPIKIKLQGFEQNIIDGFVELEYDNLPDEIYDYNIYDSLYIPVKKIIGQYGKKIHNINMVKSLNIESDLATNQETIADTSGMLAITATYDSNEDTWTFNRTFSEIFNNEVKESGVLLTVVGGHNWNNSIGYTYTYDNKNDVWDIEALPSFTVPLVFNEDKFSNIYEYSEYVVGYGNVTWTSNISITVQKNFEHKLEDLSAIPTVSIIGGLTFNMNGYSLQTFSASSELTDNNGYAYYLISRNGENLTYDDAADYMELMTGSRFVPMYNLQKPLNSLFIDSQMNFYKPQFNINGDGLRIYKINATLPSSGDSSNNTPLIIPITRDNSDYTTTIVYSDILSAVNANKNICLSLNSGNTIISVTESHISSNNIQLIGNSYLNNQLSIYTLNFSNDQYNNYSITNNIYQLTPMV